MSFYEELYGWIRSFVSNDDLDENGQLTDSHIDANLSYFTEDFFDSNAANFSRLVSQHRIFNLNLRLNDTRGVLTIGKKLLLYSDISILEVEEDPDYVLSATGMFGDDPRDYRETTSEEDEELETMPRGYGVAPLRLVETLLNLRPLVEAGRIIVLPRTRLTFEQSQRSRRKGERPRLPFHLSAETHHAELQAQLLERSSSNELASAFAMEIRLPHLKDIPLKELLAFRQHNEEYFGTFYRQLKSLCEKFEAAGVQREQALLDIITEVDYEVRKLDNLCRQEKRASRALAAYELVFLGSGLVLHGTFPDVIPESLLAALGGATVKSVIDKLRGSPRSKPSESPFYVPWKLHEEFANKQKKGKPYSF